jgi:ATP-dependent RNA helicase RhlE
MYFVRYAKFCRPIPANTLSLGIFNCISILTFDDFKLHPAIMEGLDSMGYKSPTPIQQQAIPIILDNHDLIACAQTGTGKTAAYILPVLHKILQSPVRGLNTLIVAPTRELAVQIDQQIEGFSYFENISSIAVYGGGDGVTWELQKRALTQGADVIIATPGRLIAQLGSGAIKLDQIRHLILDEADRMLDMGFHDDIVKIISHLPKERQTLLFSATMPPKIRELAKRILHEPKEITIALSKPAEGILQQAYSVYDTQKEKLLQGILENPDFVSVIIFASTKENVKKLGQLLHRKGYSVKAFSSDLEQVEREKIMNEFKNRQLRILVGTDILSRGIDVEGVSLVVNYDSPPDPEDYVHRIGRTARAATRGTAITFINPADQYKFARIEKLIEKEVPKLPLPEGLGEGPEYNPGKSSGGGDRKKFNRNKRKPFRREGNPGGGRNQAKN